MLMIRLFMMVSGIEVKLFSIRIGSVFNVISDSENCMFDLVFYIMFVINVMNFVSV